MAFALNDEEIADGPVPVAGVRDIVLVGSGKGGVGKSTVAVNLAVALAQAGQRCGIVDLDLSGPSVARLFGTSQAPELGGDGLAIPPELYGVQVISVADMIPPEQAVAWKGPLVAQAVEQLIREVAWDDLDVLVVDLPPGTGDVYLTVLEQVPATGAVVVTTPERMATIDAERAVAMFHEHDVPVFGILRNLAEYICPCCGQRQALFDPGQARDVARHKHVADLGAIPADLAAARQAAGGVPMVAADPDGPTGQAFADLAARVCEGVERERAGMKMRRAAGRTIWELLDDT
jgi:ATP-binding protein involved in chromosome partitioning